jgi:hypothetical protein
MQVRTKIGRHPKIFLKAPFESGSGTMRVKVEVNTFERSPARPLVHARHTVSSQWFNGDAEVQTFDLAELVATKIRALFQRSKGRDPTSTGPLNPSPAWPVQARRIHGCRAELNLREKLGNDDFRDDLIDLVGTWPEGYDIDEAGELIVDEVLPLL